MEVEVLRQVGGFGAVGASMFSQRSAGSLELSDMGLDALDVPCGARSRLRTVLGIRGRFGIVLAGVGSVGMLRVY